MPRRGARGGGTHRASLRAGRPLAVTAAVAQPVCCKGLLLLFTGPGYSSTYRNTWLGWYNPGEGNTDSEGSPMLSGRNGKREAYDTAGLVALRFEDSSGAYAEYRLAAPFANRSLLSIVQSCMGGDRVNTGSSLWIFGHCPAVGDLTIHEGISHVAPNLPIGVGDGSQDALGWALFPLQQAASAAGGGAGGAAGGGAKPWSYALGAKGRTNPGYMGQVFIHGVQHVAGRGMWRTVSLPCTIDAAGCVLSPNFPRPYGNSEHCSITPIPDAVNPIWVETFDTELGHDKLLVNGGSYSGTRGPGRLLPGGTIIWSSDHSLSAGGWRLCPAEPASFSEEAPVAAPAPPQWTREFRPASPPASASPSASASALSARSSWASRTKPAFSPSSPPPTPGPGAGPYVPSTGVTSTLLLLAAAAASCQWLLARRRRRRAEQAASEEPEEASESAGPLLAAPVAADAG